MLPSFFKNTPYEFSGTVASNHRKPGIHIAWIPITYRSVALLVLAFAAVAFISMRLVFPPFMQNTLEKAGGVTSRVLEKAAGMTPATGTGVVTAQQAHSTARDGSVGVKKGNGNAWVAADDHIPLEKCDVVQTGREGMAKVMFNDSTSYTVKQDSRIVIQENSANDQQQANVAVAVSTGTVGLSTATYSQESRSQVMVAGATASLDPESAAQVHHDPKADQDEILIKKGTGEVTRNGETAQLANWENVSVQDERSHLQKATDSGPPTPIPSTNMAPLFSNRAPTKDIEFSWTAMTNAVGYGLRVSRNPYFSSTLVDQKANMAAVTVRKQASEGASQTRDDGSANSAPRGAVRPGPSAGKAPASG